jgi:hypothetical protein
MRHWCMFGVVVDQDFEIVTARLEMPETFWGQRCLSQDVYVAIGAPIIQVVVRHAPDAISRETIGLKAAPARNASKSSRRGK